MRTFPLYRRIGIVLAVAVLPAVSFAAARKTSRNEWQQPDRVVRDLHLEAGSRVADIGAGSGYFTYRLAKAVGAAGKVYATDIAAKTVKAMAARVTKERLSNIEPVLSGPAETKLAADSVDVAFVCNVLHHVPAAGRAALTKDVVRSIKPGGFLFIVDWRLKADVRHDRNRRISRGDLVKLATDTGVVLDAEFFYLTNQVFLRFRKPIPPKGAK